MTPIGDQRHKSIAPRRGDGNKSGPSSWNPVKEFFHAKSKP